MIRLTLLKQIPLAVCLISAFTVTTIHAQRAGTDPVKKLCMLNVPPLLGLPTNLVVAAAPGSNCPAATTEIQPAGEHHSATLDADGHIENSDGGIQLVSHDPDSGIYVYDVAIAPGANDVDLSVQPGPEVSSAGVADDVTAEVNKISNDGTTVEFQVIESDNTTDQPIRDALETSNASYEETHQPTPSPVADPISVVAPSSPGCSCSQSQSVAGLPLRKSSVH